MDLFINYARVIVSVCSHANRAKSTVVTQLSIYISPSSNKELRLDNPRCHVDEWL